MKHELPDHIRDDLAKQLACHYALGACGPRPFYQEPGFPCYEANLICRANKEWEKHKDAYRYTINQILEGNGQTIIP